MARSRLTRKDRLRPPHALKGLLLDRLEERALVAEPINVFALSLGVPMGMIGAVRAGQMPMPKARGFAAVPGEGLSHTGGTRSEGSPGSLVGGGSVPRSGGLMIEGSSGFRPRSGGPVIDGSRCSPVGGGSVPDRAG